MNIKQNQPLKEFNWWKVGGHAEYYAAPSSEEELISAVQWAFENKKNITVLGGGSNVLISDLGIPGLLIHTHQLIGEEVISEGDSDEKDCFEFSALSGTAKSQAMKMFMQRKLSPAAFLIGLPGDVAGGVAMNAGVAESRTPREFCEIVSGIDVIRFDGSKEFIDAKSLQWSYRKCLGWQPGVISKVYFKWLNQPSDQTVQQVREVSKNRVKKQPINKPTCGSTFRNPEGHKAGALIEQAGLKGFSIGGAQISELHANFLVNNGDATAKDIKELIDHIQKVVSEKFEVDLQTEVVFMGEHK